MTPDNETQITTIQTENAALLPTDGSALPWPALRAGLYRMSEPESYPKALLAHAQQHWPVYAEHFRDELASLVAQPDDFIDNTITLPIYAGYLLAQFRDEGCFDIMQTLTRWSYLQFENVLGDEYPDTLEAWLAAFCHQSPERLQWLMDVAYGIQGHRLQMRFCALRALARCTVDALLSPERYNEVTTAAVEKMIAEGQSAPQTQSASPDDGFEFPYSGYVAFAVCDLMAINLTDELFLQIKDWFDRGHVDTSVVDLKSVKKALQEKTITTGQQADRPTQASQSQSYTKGLPGDIDTEISSWAWFQPETQTGRFNDLDTAPDTPEFLAAMDRVRQSMMLGQGNRNDDQIPEPFLRLAPKLGRNDPCSCGSGKKYKKCCGV